VNDWLKTAGVIGPVVLAVLWAVFHFGQIVERETIANLPADTVTVIRVDTAEIVRVLERLDTVRVRSIDTIYIADTVQNYVATGDTIIDGVRIQAQFIQSLPISLDGIFRFSVTIPDSLRTVEERVVYITKTVVESDLPWEWVIITFVLGFVAGISL